MCCSRCNSTKFLGYYLFANDVIMQLCYDCRNLYDAQIISIVVKKEKCYFDIMTGYSYPF